MKKITITHNQLLITYKLLHDTLFLILFAFAGLLFSDALLPGIITSKISFSKIVFLLIATMALTIFVGKKLEISYLEKKTNKNRLLPALVLFSFLLIGNSLLKFTLWENLIITLTTLFIFFLFHELLFADKK